MLAVNVLGLSMMKKYKKQVAYDTIFYKIDSCNISLLRTSNTNSWDVTMDVMMVKILNSNS